MWSVSIWASAIHFVQIYFTRDLGETPRCEKSFPFQKMWLSNVRQVPVPGVAVFLSFLSMISPACVHMWSPSLHPWQFTLKTATRSSFSLLNCIAAIRRGKSKVTRTPGFARRHSHVVAEKAWGFFLSLTCFSTLTHEFTPYLSLVSASAFVQRSYKRREDIHTHACSFSRGRGKWPGIFIVVESEKYFSTETWEMKVGRRN